VAEATGFTGIGHIERRATAIAGTTGMAGIAADHVLTGTRRAARLPKSGAASRERSTP